jgi:hypothetical protein
MRGQVLQNLWKLRTVEHYARTKNFLGPFSFGLKCGLNGLAEIAVARETVLLLDTEKLVVIFAAQTARKKF